jgi:hypothetical protein
MAGILLGQTDPECAMTGLLGRGGLYTQMCYIRRKCGDLFGWMLALP